MTEHTPSPTQSRPPWSPRKLQDWLEHRGHSRPDWPDRSMPLPVGASDRDVSATYIDGILEIRVPVDDDIAEARKVTVARG